VTRKGYRLLESIDVTVATIEELKTPAPAVSDKNSADVGQKIRYACDRLEDILAQLDITLSAFRDALRGAGNKDFTTLEADVESIDATLDVPLSTRASEGTLSLISTELTNKPDKATTPTIYNVTCTNADTEYSQTLPANTKKFTIKARGGSLKVCFTSGQSGTTYILLADGQSWSEDNIEFSGTLYFQSPSAGTVAEIIAWT